MPPPTLPAAKLLASSSTFAEGAAAADEQTAAPQRHPLTAVQPARWYVVGFDLHEAEEHRLRTMGLFEGQTVLLVKRNPLIIKVAGARVALAREIAGGVYVSASCSPTA